MVAVVIAAGGGGDNGADKEPAAGGGGGNEDEAQITSVIETDATSTAPADCTKLYTQSFLNQTKFDVNGQEAVDACVRDMPFDADNSDSVDVTDVRVSGDSATADAHYTGGLFDGQTLVFSLRKNGDQWKLDQFDDIKGFDVQRFADAWAETAPKFTNQTQKEANCAAKVFASMSPNEVKAGLLSGDSEQLFPFAEDCEIAL